MTRVQLIWHLHRPFRTVQWPHWSVSPFVSRLIGSKKFKIFIKIIYQFWWPEKKLIRSLPRRFKVTVRITKGSHSQVNFSGWVEKNLKMSIEVYNRTTSDLNWIEIKNQFQEDQINRQLEDKERVAAALENDNLIKVVNSGLRRSIEIWNKANLY